MIFSFILDGEDGLNLETSVQLIQDRWNNINQFLNQNQKNYQVSIDLTRILNEIEAITRVLHTHERWLETIGPNLDEVENLNRIQDLCKVSYSKNFYKLHFKLISCLGYSYE